MGASYMTVRLDDGREEMDIESNALCGVLRSGPAGFPEPPQGSRKWWSAGTWLAWAGTGAEWLYVDEDVN
jgi:hypothetical protein